MSQDQPPTAVPDQPTSPSPSSSDPGGLRGFIARARGQTRGDVIAANVGAGAENVAVGKFIFQNNVRIGTVVLPVRFALALVLALLVVVAVGAYAAWLYFVPAEMPNKPDATNIAVAEFGQLDSKGQVQHSDDGAQLSRWMFDTLRPELKALPNSDNYTVWHDSMPFTEKRPTIGIISDEAQAKKIAQQIKANMIIYGNLAVNQKPATFVPQFYIHGTAGEADEVSGSQSVGGAVPLNLPVDYAKGSTLNSLNKNLGPRSQLMLWTAQGLALDLSGDHAQALQTFRQAEQELVKQADPQRPFNAWARDQGLEVLYYFIAREALFLASDEGIFSNPALQQLTGFKSAEDALAAAEQANRTALAIHPNYPHALFGLGNVNFQRGQKILLARKSDPASLDTARAFFKTAQDWYTQALSQVLEAPATGIAVRSQIALGMTNFLLGESYLLGNDAKSAEAFLQFANQKLRSVLPDINAEDYRTRALTLLALGAAQQEFAHARLVQGDTTQAKTAFGQAVSNYQACIDLTNQQTDDSYMTALREQNCQPDRDAAQAASDNVK